MAEIDKRLISAKEFVRQGAYFSDIGTDHAYLPIFLLKSGIIERAICSDINEGPLAVARENLIKEGLIDKVELYISDGAKGISHLEPTDIAIFGMGGELIADIIENSIEFFKRRGTRVILQPMSRQAHLRRYLASRGFSIVGESYSSSSGRYYLTLAAEYTGECMELSDFEAEFGRIQPRVKLSPEMRGYIKAKMKSLKRARDGKLMGCEDASAEAELLRMAEEAFKDL